MGCSITPRRTRTERSTNSRSTSRINIGEAFDVEATLAGPVWAEFGHELAVPVLETADQVEHLVLLAGGNRWSAWSSVWSPYPTASPQSP